MFNNLLGIFNSLKETLIVIAVIAVIILLKVILLKFKNGKWVILGLMALVLVVGGVFTGYANYEYFTAKGGTFGSFGDIFKNKNKLMQNNLTFNFENFVLVATGNGNEYSARLSIDAVDQKMTNKAIFVNGNPTKLVARGDTYIFSDYNYTFKDENLTEICSDTLTIKFVFNSKSSECILSTIGGLDKVLYWNYFLKKNDFIVEIKDEEYKRDESVRVDFSSTDTTSNVIRYFVNGELFQVDAYEAGTDVALLTKHDIFESKVPDKKENSYIFYGWFTEPPSGDLKKNTGITQLPQSQTGTVTLFARFFRVRATGEEGYSDASVTINYNINENLVSYADDLGILEVIYYDEELGYERVNSYKISQEGFKIAGLKYAEMTFKFKLITIANISGKQEYSVSVITSYKSNTVLNVTIGYKEYPGIIIIASI